MNILENLSISASSPLILLLQLHIIVFCNTFFKFHNKHVPLNEIEC